MALRCVFWDWPIVISDPDKSRKPGHQTLQPGLCPGYPKHWSSWVHTSTPPDLDPPPTFNLLMFVWCMWAQAHIRHRTTPAVRTQPTCLVLSFHQGSRDQAQACVASVFAPSHQPLAFQFYKASLCGSDKQQSPVHKPGQVIYVLVFETGSQSREPCLQHAVYNGIISVNHLNIPLHIKITNIWVCVCEVGHGEECFHLEWGQQTSHHTWPRDQEAAWRHISLIFGSTTIGALVSSNSWEKTMNMQAKLYPLLPTAWTTPETLS